MYIRIVIFSFTVICLLTIRGAIAESRDIDSLIQNLNTLPDDSIKVDNLNQIAGMLIDKDLQECRKFANMALELSGKSGYKTGKISSLYNIGNSYYLQGSYPESLDCYLRALKIVEEAGDKHGIATSMMGVANIYYIQKDYEQALEYQFKTLKIFQELNDSVTMAGIMNNIGAVYFAQNKLELSLQFYNKSLEIKKKHDDKRSLSSAYGNIGSIYCNLGRYDEALESQNKALEIRKSLNNKKGIVMSQIDIGAIYDSLGQHDKAESYYIKGLEYANTFSYAQGRLNSYNNLSKIYRKQNKPYKALSNIILYYQLKDSIYNSQKSEQLAEMQTRYETEKKEKEIEILTLDKEVQELKLVEKDYAIKQQRIILIITILGLIVLSTLAIILFKLLKFKKQANIELSNRNQEILNQKEIIALKNQDITDSLEYAKTIQESSLVSMGMINNLFKESFVLYKPKDHVGGDFYWAHKTRSGKIIWTAADCTGHGVPGALVSILSISLLNEIVTVKGIDEPDLILNELRFSIIKRLSQLENEDTQKDGVDLVLCAYEPDSAKLQFSSINNPLILVRNNELKLFKADKLHAANYTLEKITFTRQEIDIENDDIIYLFSDGFQDQFGGSACEKYKFGNLKDTLLEVHQLPMAEQKDVLTGKLEKWMDNIDDYTGRDFEQTDDILIFGVRLALDHGK